MKIAAFITALLVAFVTHSQPKTDLERENLIGPVKSVTTYHFKGISDKEIIDYNDSLDDGVTTTNYDIHGYTVQRLSQYRYLQELGSQVTVEKYAYTDDYQHVTKNKYAGYDSLVQSIQVEYDAKGNIKCETQFTPEGELIARSIYTYNNENETRKTEYDSKGKVIRSWLFQQNATKDTLYSFNLGRKDKTLYGYQFVYDARKNQVSLIEFDKNGEVFSKIEITYQLYDQHGNWTKRVTKYTRVAKHTWLEKKMLKRNKKNNTSPTTYRTQIRIITYYEKCFGE